MQLALIGIAAGVATMLGGALALRLRDRTHLILGFSAGAVVAVAFFDLLPEAIGLSVPIYSVSEVLSLVALGFFVYLLLDRVLLLHSHAHDEVGEESHEHARGHIRAGSLSLHSVLDGVGIGLAFHVSPAVGLVVAAAVLAHDFSDGINTVNVITRHGGSRTRALLWLGIDALAPLLGIGATLLFSVSDAVLGLLLALFAGFFLYIGASDLIPESHHAHPKLLTTVMTLAGALVLFVVIKLAGL